MATKKKNTKTETKTLKLFPDQGVLGLIVDVTVTSMLLGSAFIMLMVCIHMAQKITIVVGK
jgi:hypothetical protein